MHHWFAVIYDGIQYDLHVSYDKYNKSLTIYQYIHDQSSVIEEWRRRFAH